MGAAGDPTSVALQVAPASRPREAVWGAEVEIGNGGLQHGRGEGQGAFLGGASPGGKAGRRWVGRRLQGQPGASAEAEVFHHRPLPLCSQAEAQGEHQPGTARPCPLPPLCHLPLIPPRAWLALLNSDRRPHAWPWQQHEPSEHQHFVSSILPHFLFPLACEGSLRPT